MILQPWNLQVCPTGSDRIKALAQAEKKEYNPPHALPTHRVSSYPRKHFLLPPTGQTSSTWVDGSGKVFPGVLKLQRPSPSVPRHNLTGLHTVLCPGARWHPTPSLFLPAACQDRGGANKKYRRSQDQSASNFDRNLRAGIYGNPIRHKGPATSDNPPLMK